MKFYATGFESPEVWNSNCSNTSIRKYFPVPQCSRALFLQICPMQISPWNNGKCSLFKELFYQIIFLKIFFRPFFNLPLFFHLKKIELRFFYLRLFVTGVSLNSTTPVHPLITRHQWIVTTTHQCGYLYISTDNKKSIFKAPKLFLRVYTKIYCWFCSNAGRKYHNYIERKILQNPARSIIFLKVHRKVLPIHLET